MAEGHDREILRRLDAQARRLGDVEDTMSGGDQNTEASFRYGKWQAMLRGVNAHQVLVALILLLILSASIFMCVMTYTHMNDTRAASENSAVIARQSSHEFITVIKELTSVQRESNCLARTKAVDPNLCRDLSR